MSVRLRRLSHAGHVSQVRQVTEEDGKGARTHEAREARRLCKAWGYIRHAGRLSHKGTWRMWTCKSCRGNRARTARRHVRYFSTLIKISVSFSKWKILKNCYYWNVKKNFLWNQVLFEALNKFKFSVRSLWNLNIEGNIV